MSRGGWTVRLADAFRASLSLDPRTLVAFRVGLGLALLLDLVYRARHLVAFYTDAGVLPRADLLEITGRPGPLALHLLSGEPWVAVLLFVVAAAAALALTLGWKAQGAALFSWLLLTSLHGRNPMVLQSGDTLIRVLLFWSLFLPLDRRDPRSRAPVFSAASVAVMLQVALMYWLSALLKTGPAWLPEGTAVRDALMLDIFASSFGRWLLATAPAGLLTALTWGTLALEAVGPVLALVPGWPRLRLLVIAAFVAFHLGIAATLQIGLFPFQCWVAWSLFLPAAFWDYLGVRRPAPAPLPVRTRLDRALDALPAVLFLLVVAWNVATYVGFGLPYAARLTAVFLRLDQHWGMFAPEPLKDDGWYVAPGQLANGAAVDVLRAGDKGGGVSLAKPADVAATYQDALWRKYLVNLSAAEHGPYRPPYLAHVCRRWNQSHGGSERLTNVALVYVVERTQLDGGTAPPEPITLARATCGEAP